MRLQSRVVEGQDLVFSKEEGHVLGPDLVLKECNVVVDCSATAFLVNRVSFESCSIRVTKRLRDYEWYGARFEACSFTGYLRGSRFGTDPHEQFDGYGSLLNCTFRSAILHLSDFMSVNVTGIELPQWPCFTVLNPATRSDLADSEWPARIGILMEVIAELPARATAATGYAPDVIREFGGDEQVLLAGLKRFSGVVL
jgi:hypothetical protein